MSVRTRGTQSAAIDFDSYVPTLVADFMSKLRASSSRFFRERYGLAIIEWRMVAFLAAEGPSSAYQIWTRANLDKAAVSRALTVLARRGFVQSEEQLGHRRRMTLVSLTDAGREFNSASARLLMARHAQLVAGLSLGELDAFAATLRRLEARIAAMNDVC